MQGEKDRSVLNSYSCWLMVFLVGDEDRDFYFLVVTLCTESGVVESVFCLVHFL